MIIRSILFILTIFLIKSNIITAFSLKKVYSSIIPHKIHSEVHYEEFTVNKGLLNLKNHRGNVHIKTDWHSNKIFIKIIKKSSDPNNLPEVHYSQKTHSSTISIESKIDVKHRDQSIDFELIVPHTIALNITVVDGNITVSNVNNPIVLSTDTGNITIDQSKDTIKASCNKGAITISQAKSSVNASIHSGNIIITDVFGSVSATADHGSITIKSSQLSEVATIKALTDNGTIYLTLPDTVNATIYAKTLNGSVTSDFSITIKSFTTALNNDAWKRFTKEIDGIIGNGSAGIKLETKNGNIRINKGSVI